MPSALPDRADSPVSASRGGRIEDQALVLDNVASFKLSPAGDKAKDIVKLNHEHNPLLITKYEAPNEGHPGYFTVMHTYDPKTPSGKLLSFGTAEANDIILPANCGYSSHHCFLFFDPEDGQLVFQDNTGGMATVYKYSPTPIIPTINLELTSLHKVQKKPINAFENNPSRNQIITRGEGDDTVHVITVGEARFKFEWNNIHKSDKDWDREYSRHLCLSTARRLEMALFLSDASKPRMNFVPGFLESAHTDFSFMILENADDARYGEVKAGFDHRTGKTFVVKVALHYLDKNEAKIAWRPAVKQVLNEVKWGLKLKHNNIVDFRRCETLRGEQRIVMKRYLGSLETLMTRNRLELQGTANHNCSHPVVYQPSWMPYLVKGVLEGLVYLAGQGVWHLDLKANNILYEPFMFGGPAPKEIVAQNYKFVIADFGFAVEAPQKTPKEPSPTKDFTKWEILESYHAPELLGPLSKATETSHQPSLAMLFLQAQEYICSNSHLMTSKQWKDKLNHLGTLAEIPDLGGKWYRAMAESEKIVAEKGEQNDLYKKFDVKVDEAWYRSMREEVEDEAARINSDNTIPQITKLEVWHRLMRWHSRLEWLATFSDPVSHKRAIPACHQQLLCIDPRGRMSLTQCLNRWRQNRYDFIARVGKENHYIHPLIEVPAALWPKPSASRTVRSDSSSGSGLGGSDKSSPMTLVSSLESMSLSGTLSSGKGTHLREAN
ncbi:kinase-like domain-containing protein [Lasiosphaeria miniovina]|uniref:Kinase-like domain-containing protein n=1 Tax=Lasiosphaeria miniovina TaxID=1954250 RepID=A0AA40EA78_9PEZI|nr:kinase-like domain-containing protein [Lasiosphaeria miniovina]KAK0734119.1 kinase-like domain-containing protein [Lasiosphaeria miniovina]